MQTVNMDEIHAQIGHEPCSDCGEPSETVMLNAETSRDHTLYVCLSCWSERHQKRADELRADRAKGITAAKRFHAKMAGAYAEVGDEKNAAIARRMAR